MIKHSPVIKRFLQHLIVCSRIRSTCCGLFRKQTSLIWLGESSFSYLCVGKNSSKIKNFFFGNCVYMCAGYVLGIEMRDIFVIVVDTRSLPWAGGYPIDLKTPSYFFLFFLCNVLNISDDFSTEFFAISISYIVLILILLYCHVLRGFKNDLTSVS